MRIGLFFGTFDPVHTGHIQIANRVIKHNIVDRVWFVISPISPFKINQSISSPKHRVNMLNLAIHNNPKFSVSEIELQLSAPNYTANTLSYIQKNYIKNEFFIVMGSDNYENISKWQNYEYILKNFKICVYKRGVKRKTQIMNNTIDIPGPEINISSSYIRQNIKSISPTLLSSSVLNYILKHHMYI